MSALPLTADPLVESVMDGEVGGFSGQDDLMHWWCCDEKLAWCGIDLSGHAVADEGEVCLMCVLAYEDESIACPKCGGS